MNREALQQQVQQLQAKQAQLQAEIKERMESLFKVTGAIEITQHYLSRLAQGEARQAAQEVAAQFPGATVEDDGGETKVNIPAEALNGQRG